jgi:hypothetical protein
MILAAISDGEIWMICLTAAAVVVSAVGTFLKKSDVRVEQPLDVKILETLASKSDVQALAKSTRKEFDDLWFTVRNENTAIRKEITSAVSHSQEVVMDKLENNRVELSEKLDNMPDRVIATLKNTGAI